MSWEAAGAKTPVHLTRILATQLSVGLNRSSPADGYTGLWMDRIIPSRRSSSELSSTD